MYIAGTGDLQIIDARDPTHLVAAGSITGFTAPRSMVVDTEHLYIGNEQGISVLDRANPRTPTLQAQTSFVKPQTIAITQGRFVLGGVEGIALVQIIPEGLLSVRTLDATGGRLVSADGAIAIDIPAGALTGTNVITYTPLIEVENPAVGSSMLRSFRLEGRTASGQPITNVQRPITITIVYTAQELTSQDIAETTLIIDRYEEGKWLPMPSCITCDQDAGTLRRSATSDVLGIFGLRGQRMIRVLLPQILRP